LLKDLFSYEIEVLENSLLNLCKINKTIFQIIKDSNKLKFEELVKKRQKLSRKFRN